MIVPFNRDWRWWHKDWWYPSLNIYPQDEPGDWDAPYIRMNKAVARYFKKKG